MLRLIRGGPMFLSSSLWVTGPVTQHGEQGVAAAPSENDEDLVLTLARTDLASVVGAEDRVTQRSEGREEQRALEYLVAPPGRMLSAD